MATESIAKKVFGEARSFYEGGLKSANKTYDEGNASWWKQLTGKAAKRNAAQPKAAQVIDVTRKSPVFDAMDTLQKGHYLYECAGTAGNCGELAQISCYLATKKGAARNELAMVSVFTPGLQPGAKGADHAFCLYGDAQQISFLRTMLYYPTMKDIDGARAFRDRVWAIDPWANTVCSLDKYPSKIADKMQSWGGYGKRVLWCYNSGKNDWEWAPPNGEYATVFANASFYPHAV
jgi:hypothetical protein